MSTAMLILIIVVVIAIAIAAWALIQKQRSQKLQRKFGREYDHTVQELGDSRKAEAELARREKRLSKLHIVALAPEQRQRFAQAWRDEQARFVDDPRMAVDRADSLVAEVMRARGYPVGDFEQRAADVSVDHPQVVDNYRAAHDIAVRDKNGKATTEELRKAMVHYRALFEDLLENRTNHYEEVRK